MYGASVANAKYTEASGLFSKFRAVRKGGTVSCSSRYAVHVCIWTWHLAPVIVDSCGDSNNGEWQACNSACGYPTAVSFELKFNGAFLAQQSAWNTLPSNCALEVAGDYSSAILCTPANFVNVRPSDTWIATWQEPSMGISTSDNGGELHLDLYGWRDGGGGDGIGWVCVCAIFPVV